MCEFDPLRDEGIAFARRLARAGVRAELVRYPGTFHASVGLAHAAISRRMTADQIEALRRGLGREPPSPPRATAGCPGLR